VSLRNLTFLACEVDVGGTGDTVSGAVWKPKDEGTVPNSLMYESVVVLGVSTGNGSGESGGTVSTTIPGECGKVSASKKSSSGVGDRSVPLRIGSKVKRRLVRLLPRLPVRFVCARIP